MNLLLVVAEGLDGVGAPLEGLEEVLFDPEVRARATPNLGRLAAIAARFDKAYAGTHHPAAIDLENLMAHARVKGGYVTETAAAGELDPPPHDRTRGKWSSPAGQTLRRWTKLVPKDPSVANWERLANAQDAIATAAAVAEAIDQPGEGGKPRLLVAQLMSDGTTHTPGVFFDRFPLDQIRLPADPEARRALAERMGAYGFDATDLSEDDELAWKRAIQAWLAEASKLDYAIGSIVDALEGVDPEVEAPWIVALVAPPAGLPSQHAVGESGARAGLLIAAPGLTQPGQRVATPIELTGLQRTLVELIGVDPEPFNDFDKPVRAGSGTFMRPLPGESLLPLLAPAGERYDRVAITSANGAYGVRSHRFRLVQIEDSQALYDLEKDPEGFYNLLDPDNAAMVERFGLTVSQVEAVRRWHTSQLYHRLLENADPKIELDQVAELAGIDPDGPRPEQPPAVVPGDYNRDGRVDAADTTVWRDQNGKEVPVGSGADGDHDGRIDDQDNVIWRSNYGRRAETP